MADNWIACPTCKAEIRESYLSLHNKKAHSDEPYISSHARKLPVTTFKSTSNVDDLPSCSTKAIPPLKTPNYSEEEPLAIDGMSPEPDKYQEAFCNDRSRLIRLLAPAGSGKTQSLLWRCLEESKNAEGNSRFLVFTFSRPASHELRHRLNSDPAFETIRNFVEISTLNAWGLRRLKLRLNNLRTITDKIEKFRCMANLLQPAWQDNPAIKEAMTDNRRKSRAARVLLELMDSFKSMGFRHDKQMSFTSFEQHVEWLHENGMATHWAKVESELEDLEIINSGYAHQSVLQQIFENFYWFWQDASIRMNESAMLTFEDQKYWASIDVEKAVLEERFTTGMHRFQHILVDEFQDINPLDLALLKNIANINKAKLCIIGDDDQAIYEWRGATPTFILNPDTHIENGYKTYILEQNYRCPKNIVETSQKLIKHNRNRVDKDVRASSNANALIEVVDQPTLEDSVNYVLNSVKGLLKDRSVHNIAIIGRKRSQIIPYQIVFASNDLEFYAAEDLHILLSDTFKGLKEMLMLRSLADVKRPYQPDPIEAVLKLCDKVKRYPLNKIDKDALKNFLLSKRPKSIREATEALYEYTGPLKKQPMGSSIAQSFYLAITEVLNASDVADTIRAISENFNGLQKDYTKSLDDIFFADPPFLYLSDYAQRYGDDFDAFYEDIEKAIDTLAKIPTENDDDSEGVHSGQWKCRLHLMTALRAKGKEFDAVFILDCNKGVFPIQYADTEALVEAERRLFYVAMTRAKKQLTFMVNDKILGEIAPRSIFLSESGL